MPRNPGQEIKAFTEGMTKKKKEKKITEVVWSFHKRVASVKDPQSI